MAVRDRIRRGLTVCAILVACAILVFVAAGDRLTGRNVFTAGYRASDADEWDDAMRFVWDEMGPLPEPLGLADAEGGPALSAGQQPDLYFSRRNGDNGWDLFRARWTPDGFATPEPLFELNSGHDEVDPLVIDDGSTLLFASNRPGGLGGYDLYRADLTEDGFDTPRPMGAPLCSKYDDRHPTTDRLGARLIFCSTRLSVSGHDHDFFESKLTSRGFEAPELLRDLEREEGDTSGIRSPALSPDGRFLFFASDREGGAGGYDIYRSVRWGGRWNPPEPVESLNTPEDELDPAFSAEGGTLVFARSVPDGDGLRTILNHAERREIFRFREGDSFWENLLLVLIALLLALLLTLLYLKWKNLHPFIKFILLSIIAHLLILLFVEPPEGGDFGFSSSQDRGFSVSFLRSSSDSSSEANGRRAATGEQVTAQRMASSHQVTRQVQEVQDTPSLRPEESAAAKNNVAQREETVRDDARDMEEPSRRAAKAASAVAEVPSAVLKAGPRKNVAEAERGEVVGGARATESNQVVARMSASHAATGGQTPSLDVNESVAAASTAMERRGHDPSASELAESRLDVTSDARRSEAPRASSTGERAREAGATKRAVAKHGTPAAASSARDTAADRMDGSQSAQASANRLVQSLDKSAAAAARGTELQPEIGMSSREVASESAADLADANPAARARGGAPRPNDALRSRASEGGERHVARADEPSPGDRGPSAARATEASRRTGGGGRISGRRAVTTPGAQPEVAFRPGSALRRRSGPSADATSLSPVAHAGRARRGAVPRPSAMRAGVAAPVARASEGRRAEVAITAKTFGGAESARRASTIAEDRPSMSRALAQGGPVTGRRRLDVSPRDLLSRRQPVLGSAPTTDRAPRVYANRKGRAKAEALQIGGGSDETEAAVLAGLRYLQKKQRSSGAWGRETGNDKYGDVRIGKTALAVLAFLGSGYTHTTDNEFRDTVTDGIRFLIQQQDPRSGHIGDCSAYGHGISAYALAEAFAMTNDEELEQPLRRAIRRVIRAQYSSRNPRLDGGWRYYYPDDNRLYDRWPRMSVTVWQIMALKSATIGGITVPSGVFERARRFVLHAFDSELEAFRYNHDPGWLAQVFPTLPGSSSAALFAMQLLGVPDDDPRMGVAVDYVMKRLPDRRWRKFTDTEFARAGKGNIYFMYYGALGLFRYGGDAWKRWNAAMTRSLVNNQADDGSWRNISPYSDYADDRDNDPCYVTAMAVLTLEVYYRYFTPLLQAIDQEQKQGSSGGMRLVVESVERGSRAARAGLRDGDVILLFGTRRVRRLEDIEEQLGSIDRRTKTPMIIERSGARRVLTLRGKLAGLTLVEEE